MAQGGCLVSSIASQRLTTIPPVICLSQQQELILLLPKPNVITVFSSGVVLYETRLLEDFEIVAWSTAGDKLVTGEANGTIRMLSVSKQSIEIVTTLPMPEASCRLVDLAVVSSKDEKTMQPKILVLLQDEENVYQVFKYDAGAWESLSSNYKFRDDTCQWIRPYKDGFVIIGRSSVLLFDSGKKRFLAKKTQKSGDITACAVRDQIIVVGFTNGSLLVVQEKTTRRLHWHAHAVSSIAIGVDGSIHTAGEEAVWITWDAVNDRPKQMLPRIAPAKIDHLMAVDPSRMMIYANNTIFMYDTITLRLNWKYQGLVQTTTSPRIYGHVGENRLALSGSPGNIYLFQNGTVQSQWTVAPYNRISKANREYDMPPPKITCVAQFDATWLTVHENYLEASPTLVVVQFWDRPNYCAASMVQGESILTCALHNETAVTITKSHLQFWDAPWTCRTKVAIPAGFSKHTVTTNPVYSEDGSILAIAFGRHVTLWNPITVKLLLSIPLVEEIQQIAFVKDALVVRTLSEVTCLSVLGSENWTIGDIQATAMGIADDAVVVSDQNSILVVNTFTGETEDRIKNDFGPIVSLYARIQDDRRLWIHATTEKGELVEIKDSSLDTRTNGNDQQVQKLEASNAPTLPSFQDESRKRRFIEISDLEDWCPSKMASIEQLADDELPLLRGEFVMAFLGRNLRRKPQ